MELYINLFSGFILSALFSWLLLPRIQHICFKKGLFDSCDERKVHTGIVPRLGGVSFFPALMLAFLLVMSVNLFLETFIVSSVTISSLMEWMLALSALILLYLTGLGDDLVNVRYRAKLLIQVITGGLFTASGVWINNLYGLFGFNEIHAVIGILFYSPSFVLKYQQVKRNNCYC